MIRCQNCYRFNFEIILYFGQFHLIEWIFILSSNLKLINLYSKSDWNKFEKVYDFTVSKFANIFLFKELYGVTTDVRKPAYM